MSGPTYLSFTLWGSHALWRNPYSLHGDYSALGPPPSQIAGLLGAAHGFAAPRTIASSVPLGSKWLKGMGLKGVPHPVSPELLEWQEKNEYAFGCRWLGGVPRRVSWNICGHKDASRIFAQERLRRRRMVVEAPRYQVLVRLNNQGAAEVAARAILNPAFPMYLGNADYRAIVEDILVLRAPRMVGYGCGWAYRVSSGVPGEVQPFTCHVVNPGECGERITIEGDWMYPTPRMPRSAVGNADDPCVCGYCRLSPKGVAS